MLQFVCCFKTWVLDFFKRNKSHVTCLIQLCEFTKFHNTKWQYYVVKSNYHSIDVMNMCSVNAGEGV